MSHYCISCSDSSDNTGGLADNVLVFTDQKPPHFLLQQIIDESATDPGLRLPGKIHGKPITVVKLSGKTHHFGRYYPSGEYLDYHATVSITPESDNYIGPVYLLVQPAVNQARPAREKPA